MRLGAALGLFACLVSLPVVASARPVGDRCPAYVAHLVRARDCLTSGDQQTAIAALRDAQAALKECLRRECDEAGEQVMLAASPRSTDRL